MRRLMLLRHAKSDWPEGVADLDRPLAKRGRKEAPAVGTFMAAGGLRPDQALVSPAARARETWDLVAPAFAPPPRSTIEPRAYMATADALLDLIRLTDPEIRTLLLVGHNPGMEEFARALVGGGSAEARRRLALSYPTSALAVFEIASDWVDLQPQGGALAHFVTPQSLGVRK
jgi:phosphohistidine phosphatase